MLMTWLAAIRDLNVLLSEADVATFIKFYVYMPGRGKKANPEHQSSGRLVGLVKANA